MNSFLIKTISILLVLIHTGNIQAAYPDKPIHIIVPYAPGGGVDVVARIMAIKLQDKFKQSVIVENRPGAAGMIAAQFLTRSEPNGYTLMIDTISITMNPSLNKKIPYNPSNILPIAKLISLPFVVAVNSAIPVKNLNELIEYIKINPTKTNLAMAGSSTRFAAELFKLSTGTDFTMVSYQGAAPTVMSLVSGSTQFSVIDLPSIAQQISNGKVRVLATTTKKRIESLPSTLTTPELGFNDFVISSWYGIFAPIGTNQEIVKLLNDEFNRIIALPDVLEKFKAMGAEADAITQEEFRQLYLNDINRWRDVVTKSNMVISE